MKVNYLFIYFKTSMILFRTKRSRQDTLVGQYKVSKERLEHLNWNPQVKMSHCLCEANKCVDTLARRGTASSQDFVLLDSHPMDLCMLFFYDNSSLDYQRFCPLYSDVFVSVQLMKFGFNNFLLSKFQFENNFYQCVYVCIYIYTHT